MCRINPRVDFAFKKLFGSAENQDLLLALLNAILTEEPPITEVQLKNPYNLADYQAGKISILDIKAKDENGRWFNVEMQISQDYDFDKRAIYYWAKLITEQITEGTLFKTLQKTFSINILNFNFVPDTEVFHNRYKIINTATGKDDRLHDLFELHYLELRKFHKPWAETLTALDRWFAFLSRAHELDKHHLPPQMANDPAITKAIRAVDRMFDEDERQIYEVRMQAVADINNKIESAMDRGLAVGHQKGLREGWQEGRQQGLQEGIQEGIQQGVQEGIQQGIQAGERKAREAIARTLLAVLDAETVAEKTGLSLAEVQQLSKNG